MKLTIACDHCDETIQYTTRAGYISFSDPVLEALGTISVDLLAGQSGNTKMTRFFCGEKCLGFYLQKHLLQKEGKPA